MVANIVVRALEELESQTVSPSTIEKAAGLLRGGMEQGFGAPIVESIQQARLALAVEYAYERSAFYRERFHKERLIPENVETPEGLLRLPFTTSDELRDWRSFLCVPEEELAGVFTTSGTTGEPKQLYFTYSELQMLTNFSALALLVRHETRLKVLVALPMRHGLWIGSGTAPQIVRQAGGIPYPVGAGAPEETLVWMRRFDCNTVMSSPSYMTALTQQAQAEGYQQHLENILVGGEMLTEERISLFHDYWGATVFNSYGLTEIGGAQSISLPTCKGFYVNDLHLYTEIIDPDTGSPADEGELVFTTLTRKAMPLLRYRSGDRARWLECEQELPFRAFEILGRLDDMLIVGGVHLYATVVADAITDAVGGEPRVRIVIDREASIDLVTLLIGTDEAEPNTVRQAFFSAYPEAEDAVNVGRLNLEVKTGIDLGGQIKQLGVEDRRF